MSSHALTKISHDLASQHDLALYFRITQIQITIFQTDILVCIFRMIDLERQLIITALSKHFYFARNDLNITSWNLVIFAASLANDSIYLNRGLIVKL